MSGGSFNYLFREDASALPGRLPDLEDMARTLTAMGFHDAAAETEAIIAYIQHAERQVEARRARLTDVWYAVEWKCSGDCGMDRVEREIEKYRNA